MDLKQFTLLIGVASLPSMATAATVYRTISKVSVVTVDCPEGTAPRLPNLVWVTYSDGYSEYRQVRWANAPLADEQAEADAQKHPAGSQYEIGGFVIGDETTDNGYPVKAQIKVVAEGYQTPEKEVAHTFSLADVSIDGDNRLTHNRDEALREICSWDVTQQLYNYRDTYGLSTEGYTKSDGWDSPDTKLKGHGSGHYMSAIAQAYAVATNPEQKAILRKNITRMVNELRECQEKTFVYNKELKRNWEARDFAPEAELREMKGTWAAFDEYKKHPELYGYGYINAIPAQHCALIEMYRAYNNSDWVWAPYYSVHKQLAGLIDIATYFDDKEICDKALLIAKDMGLWVWNRMHYRRPRHPDRLPRKRGQVRTRSRAHRAPCGRQVRQGQLQGFGRSARRGCFVRERTLDAAHRRNPPRRQNIPPIVQQRRSDFAGRSDRHLRRSRNHDHLQTRRQYLHAHDGIQVRHPGQPPA